MGKASRKETAAIVFVIVVGVAWLGWMLVRAGQNASRPGVTLQEAFAQPPAGPPPGRPSLPMVGLPGGTETVPPAFAAVGSSASPASANAPSAPTGTGAAQPSAAPVPTPKAAVAHAPTPEASEVVVHVAGAVHKPGVYHLPLGARNNDAIEKAGGPTSEASLDALNLAARVEDGSQLYLPTRKQHPEGGADTPIEAAIAPTSIAAHGITKAGVKGGAHPAAAKAASAAKGGKTGKLSSPSQGTVNINTASAEELQRIPGIGPAMAERILEFRQTSGKFTTPEDLLQISGIGEKKFAKMQPFVRVK